MSLLGRLQAGTLVGGEFEVVRPLSEGGMGAVYVVLQRSTGHRRALKVMHAGLAGSADLRAKFLREATMSSKIESEHVVQVIAAGVDEPSGAPWLVMELLEGQSLGAFVDAHGPPPPEVAREIFGQLRHGLAAAERAGIVHRDLKPENLFLARSKRSSGAFTLKILDFGIAKILAEAGTHASAAIGSPAWMAPEQTHAGADITAATDVWAVGLIAFYVLTGRLFWRSAQTGDATPVMVIRELVFDEIPAASVRAREVQALRAPPIGFDAWLTRAIAREPGRRFPSCDVALGELDQLFAATSPDGAVSIEVRATGPTHATPPAPFGSWPPGLLPASGAPPPSLADVPEIVVPEPKRFEPDALAATGLAPKTARSRRWIAAASLGVVALVGGAAYVGLRAVSYVPPASSSAVAAAAPPPSASAAPLDDGVRRALDLFFDRRDPANLAKAVEALRAACAARSQDACAGMGFAEYRGAGVPLDRADAFAKFDTACAAGSLVGCAGLGTAYFEGKAGTRDEAKAVHLFQRACDGGAVTACSSLAYALAHGRGAERDDKKSYALYEAECALGTMSGCAGQGSALADGRGVPPDFPRAVGLFEKACSGGDMFGCNRLGLSLLFGQGAPKDPARGVETLRRACSGGHPGSCAALGFFVAQGIGAKRDERAGAELMESACRDRDAMACTVLGDALKSGLGVTRDLERAARYYDAACSDGVAAACVRMGLAYEKGEGVARDEGRAAERYRAACDDEAMMGCNDLGVLYEHGAGVARDEAKARDLFDQACKRGTSNSGTACLNLGKAFASGGLGLPRDAAKAKEMFAKGCELGEPAACALKQP